MKKKVILYLLIVLMVVFNACKSGNSNTKSNEKIIKIGAILPLDGILRRMGEVEKNAILLAEEHINKSGKIIQILIEDSKGKSSEAALIANKFIDIDNVDLLFVSTTSASLATEPIATSKQKNMLSFCMDLSIASKSDYVFRFYEGMDKESDVILDYLNNINNRDLIVGILHSNAPVIKDVVEKMYLPFFKENNINFKYIGEYTLNDKDFKNNAIQIRDNKINHLIIIGHGFEYESIYNSLEDYKLLEKLNIIGGWGFIYTPVSKDKLEGTVIAGPKFVFEKDTTSFFYKTYKNKYKEEPNFDAAYAYNAIIELAKFKKEDFSHPIKSILIEGNYNSSILGNYSFDKKGNMIVPLGLGRMKNGRIVSFN